MAGKGALLGLLLACLSLTAYRSFMTRLENNFLIISQQNKISLKSHDTTWISFGKLRKPITLTRPYRNGGKSNAFFMMLLLLGGPINQCQKCQFTEKTNSTADNESYLCSLCKSGSEPTTNEQPKKQLKITDVPSVIHNYKIDIDLTIPKEHPATQESKFKGKLYFFKTVPVKDLPKYIFAIYQKINDEMGETDDFHVDWIDLEIPLSNEFDEIKIVIQKKKGKSTSPWATMFIYIPTSSVAITGPGQQDLT